MIKFYVFEGCCYVDLKETIYVLSFLKSMGSVVNKYKITNVNIYINEYSKIDWYDNYAENPFFISFKGRKEFSKINIMKCEQ